MAGKPAEMIAKIADGKLNAFFKENTLGCPAFCKRQQQNCSRLLKKCRSAELKVIEFKRVALG